MRHVPTGRSNWGVGRTLPFAFIALSLGGLALFGIRWMLEPANWPSHALGVAASLFLGVRNLTVIRTNRTVVSTPGLREIRDMTTLEEALGSDRAILYKHSTICSVSSVVIDEVLRFARQHPSWDIYLLKVVEHRDLSDAVADRLGVAHESPQAFVIRQGRSIWHTSHFDITAHQLSRHLA